MAPNLAPASPSRGAVWHAARQGKDGLVERADVGRVHDHAGLGEAAAGELGIGLVEQGGVASTIQPGISW
jgi:hypothetical protein